MKSLSGKDLLKLLEKNGWQLLRINAAITSMVSQAVSSGYPCQCMAISL